MKFASITILGFSLTSSVTANLRGSLHVSSSQNNNTHHEDHERRLSVVTDTTCGAKKAAVWNIWRNMYRGNKIYSSNGKYYVTVSAAGDLQTVRTRDSKVLWTAGGNLAGNRAGALTKLQADGNLVTYRGGALWASGTHGRAAGSVGIMKDDGSFELVDPNDGCATKWNTPPDTTCGAMESAVWNIWQEIHSGNKIYSSNGRYYATVTANGDLQTVRTADSKVFWTAGGHLAGNRAGALTKLQADGNLVTYRGGALWASGTNGKAAGSVGIMKDDGSFQLVDPNDNCAIKWNTPPDTTCLAKESGGIWNIWQELHSGNKIYSSNGMYYVTVTATGDLQTVRTVDSNVLWTAGGHGLGNRAGALTKLQADGNLVTYRGGALWASGTQGRAAGSVGIMKDDGSLQLVDPNENCATKWNTASDRFPLPYPLSEAACNTKNCAIHWKSGWSDYSDFDEMSIGFSWYGGKMSPLCGVSSYHHNDYEDRRFRYKYSYPLYPTQTSPTHSVTLTPYDGESKVECPGNSFIASISSHHDNGSEDRRFSYNCNQYLGNSFTDKCYWTDYVNEFDQAFDFECSGDQFVLTGMESYHRNHYEDRRFKFKCCRLSLITEFDFTIQSPNWKSAFLNIEESDETKANNTFIETSFCPSENNDIVPWSIKSVVSLPESGVSKMTKSYCKAACHVLQSDSTGWNEVGTCEFAHYSDDGVCTIYSKGFLKDDDGNIQGYEPASYSTMPCNETGGVFLIPEFDLVVTLGDIVPVGGIGLDFLEYMKNGFDPSVPISTSGLKAFPTVGETVSYTHCKNAEVDNEPDFLGNKWCNDRGYSTDNGGITGFGDCRCNTERCCLKENLCSSTINSFNHKYQCGKVEGGFEVEWDGQDLDLLPQPPISSGHGNRLAEFWNDFFGPIVLSALENANSYQNKAEIASCTSDDDRSCVGQVGNARVPVRTPSNKGSYLMPDHMQVSLFKWQNNTNEHKRTIAEFRYDISDYNQKFPDAQGIIVHGVESTLCAAELGIFLGFAGFLPVVGPAFGFLGLTQAVGCTIAANV